MYPELEEYITPLHEDVSSIPADRQRVLTELAAYIRDRQAAQEPIRLNFICTHNSRRSLISQIWAATAAAYHGVKDVHCYSGGTEATAFNPRAVRAMERAGFRIEGHSEDNNPQYRVRFAPDAPAILCYSKVFDAPENPNADFAAVMTCSHADENCPFIPGAKRIAVTYEDPKVSDGTPDEEATYDARVRQIGRELLYAMRQAKTE